MAGKPFFYTNEFFAHNRAHTKLIKSLLSYTIVIFPSILFSIGG